VRAIYPENQRYRWTSGNSVKRTRIVFTKKLSAGEMQEMLAAT
jgi:hypothetical protein